jgi:hypothetical protein
MAKEAILRHLGHLMSQRLLVLNGCRPDDPRLPPKVTCEAAILKTKIDEEKAQLRMVCARMSGQ